MTRKVRKIQDASSDDDTPEVISHTTSKADAKRDQKAVRDFEAEEQARRKARNRERDQKLKERARVTRGGKAGEKQKSVRFSHESDSVDDGDDDDDDVEARMLRAMRDAADEVQSAEGDRDDDDDENEGFGEGMNLGSGSDSSDFAQDDDEDAEMSLEEGDLIDAEGLTDDEGMDDDDETLPRVNIRRSSNTAGYLAEDLFAAAFASQNSKPGPQKNIKSTQQRIIKKPRRKSNARPKDLVIDGRTIRMLPQLSDPRSQATARSVPSARARRFVDHSLAMRGKQALLKAKKKGWERRSANVGVMKYQGAPHGFARSTRSRF